MSLHVVNVNQVIRQVEQPFAMIELATVGEIMLHGYTCLGAVNWHKHIDYDEAFLVLDGAIALESEWGNTMLRADELAVIAKGITHRSGSQLRSLVVLMHARGLPERKNGHRRLYGLPDQGQLNKNRLRTIAGRAAPFRLEPVTKVDDYAVQLMTGNGMSPAQINFISDTLWLAISGQVQFEAGGETIELAQGELVVVPRDISCCWISFSPATLLWLGRTEAPLYGDPL